MGNSRLINRMKLENAMFYHLRYNHYPPLPSVMVDACVKAIPYARQEDWEHRIRLPKGVTWGGKKTISVADVIEYHNLDSFL
jgi:hypothetical protein